MRTSNRAQAILRAASKAASFGLSFEGGLAKKASPAAETPGKGTVAMGVIALVAAGIGSQATSIGAWLSVWTIAPVLADRWSGRAYDAAKPVSREQTIALLEALAGGASSPRTAWMYEVRSSMSTADWSATLNSGPAKMVSPTPKR
mgnify:CR=1 FL=1